MGIFKKIKETLFGSTVKQSSSYRLSIQDINIGDKFNLNLKGIPFEGLSYFNGIGQVICLNNDPIIEKIHVQVRVALKNKIKYKDLIFDYEDDIFETLNLLNPNFFTNKTSGHYENNGEGEEEEDYEEEDYEILEKALNLCVEKEYFEIANEINKKLDELKE